MRLAMLLVGLLLGMSIPYMYGLVSMLLRHCGNL